MDRIWAPLPHRLRLFDDLEMQKPRRIPCVDGLNERTGGEYAMPLGPDAGAVDLGSLRVRDAAAEKPLVRFRQRREGDHMPPDSLGRCVDDDLGADSAEFRLW